MCKKLKDRRATANVSAAPMGRPTFTRLLLNSAWTYPPPVKLGAVPDLLADSLLTLTRDSTVFYPFHMIPRQLIMTLISSSVVLEGVKVY